MADKIRSGIYRQWDDRFIVRRMIRQDAEKVVCWFSALSVMFVDLHVVLDVRGDDADVDSFYVGELNGEMIASKLEFPVADGLSYGSMFYVDERYRSSGLGRRINDVARDATESTSNNTVGIDAVSELEAMNIRRGYKTAFATTRFTGKVQPDYSNGRSGSTIRQVVNEFDRLTWYDDKSYIQPGFPWRRELVSRLIKIPGGHAVMAVSEQRDVVGYGCRRPAVSEAGHHLIGPLYADSYDIAWDLLHALSSDVIGERISINICELNVEAIRLARELKLQESLHLLRMYRNGAPKLLSHRVFGVTSIDVCGF